MKKLIILAVSLICGIVTQASTVAWAITNVKDASGATLDSGAVYVFFVAGGAKADTSAWTDLAGKGSDAIKTAVGGANYFYTKSNAAGTFSSPELALTDVGIEPSTKYSAYAVIFDTATITDDSNFYVTAASAASTTYADSSSMKKSYTLSATTSANAGSWNAVSGVPEPTSGLLLLLGMAGLALRRKQA